jgi:hypothetical protein
MTSDNNTRELAMRAAMRRYARECRADASAIYQQPCAASSETTAKHVTLRSVRGVLARYRWQVRDDGRVRLQTE